MVLIGILGFLHGTHRYMNGFGLGLLKVFLDSIGGGDINGVDCHHIKYFLAQHAISDTMSDKLGCSWK